ncbi:hypothetical protein GCM10025771_30860 [Niveibacterium umoris]|uniref:RDD domain-containing protein n=1 Tax=Niveibacterium umoris TaxID=1193620 RepID=A0A840BJE5_9RHOO|nr:RDD family protein [Niveibacterium umoris]MBB4011722.1 hypothetical protein [Niveibacterium umoris]
MPSRFSLKSLNARAVVAPEALNVSPALLGAPLARPVSRGIAMGIDLVVVGLLSSIDGLWMLAAAGLLAARLKQRRSELPVGKVTLMALAIACLLGLGAETLWRGSDTAPASKAEKVLADDDASVASAKLSDAERIAKLEEELDAARTPKELGLVEQALAFARAHGLNFGWAAVYFSLVPFWWRGQTLGKRLQRIRVVELTGKPLSIVNCFSRYGGYAAGLATGMFGFVQVLWDVNRQAIQDKIAHTVVVDEREAQT